MPSELVIKNQERQIKVTFVGPSMWGYIYASKDEGRYYRLLPVEDIHKLSLRLEIESCIGKPCRQGIAPIVEAGEISVSEESYYYIAYSTSGVSFTEILATSTDDKMPLFCIAKVIKTLQKWMNLTEGAVASLMPADIIFCQDWPLILSFPVTSLWPRFETLTAEPSRILYLPPEIIRGNRFQVREETRMFYACGILLAQCLFDIQVNLSPGDLFNLAATSSLFSKFKHQGKWPYWIEKADALKKVLNIMRITVDPDPRIRSGLNQTQASDAIEEFARFLEPLNMALEFRNKKKFREAIDFIADVSISENNFNLFLLAAKIAIEDLQRPLEAIEYYERAIAIAPEREMSAYRDQLDILLSLTAVDMNNLELGTLLERFDTLIRRDYSILSSGMQKEYVIRCAEYFLQRRMYSDAKKILYMHLFDGQIFLWWEFQRTILYAEALIVEAAFNVSKIQESRQFLESVKNALSRIMNLPADDINRRKFSQNDLKEFGERVTRLDFELLNISRQSS